MRTNLIVTSVAALCLASAVSAQTFQTLPTGFTAAEGNSNNIYPWGTTTIRVQHCYDSSYITSSGPILIQKLRWRGDGSTSTWTGGTFPSAKISISSATADYSALSTTFANNHGADLAVVFNGTVTVKAGGGSTPQKNWYIEVTLATPFKYDPNAGKDLLVDVQLNTLTGSTFRSDAVSGSAYKCSRVYNTGSATATTGNFGNNYGIIMGIDWIPAKGLFSNFTADKQSGPGPLTVQFKDTTFSSAGPVKSWAWDFDGDSKIDSNLQNPKFTYPKTGWDATYDVTLTTTDGVNPASKLTKKGFIIVDPSDAYATSFGTGSSNKPLPVPIEVSAYSSIYSAAAGIRGFYFVAPTTFIITGFEAPNDYTTKEPMQTIVCYVIAKGPTGSYAATAADVKFFGTGKSGIVMKPTSPIVVNKGDWVGVLGACHGTTATAPFRNSYGAGSYKSSVLGQSITLNRLWMNADARTNKGVGTINPSTGSLARVFIHVAGNTAVPTMDTIGRPQLGLSAKLDLVGRVPGAQGGVVLMSSGRLPAPVPTMFGNLLITPSIAATFSVPTGTGQLTLPIPNDNKLKGVMPVFQALVFNITTNTYGMSNGVEWFLGK